MSRRNRWLIIAIAGALFAMGVMWRSLDAGEPSRPADKKPIADRLYQALHARITTNRGGQEFLLHDEDEAFDPDELDPLLWHRSAYLYSTPDKAKLAELFKSAPALESFRVQHHENPREIVALLDEFLANRGETVVTDPLRRAFLQRDLWAVFDFLADPEKDRPEARRELLTRLAKVIRRLALTPEEIRKLPDNYAGAVKGGTYPAAVDPAHKSAPFLPADLWDDKGPWVALGNVAEEPLAIVHARFFYGRSTFHVFLRLPGGREATRAAVEKLSDWARYSHKTKPAELPRGTQLALVRRVVLVDNRGQLVPTPLTESMQIRVLHEPEKIAESGTQTFLEFRLRRRDLLAGKPGLTAVRDDEGERPFLHFLGNANGEEPEPIMASCRHCHNDTGLNSVNSFQGRFRLTPAVWKSTTLDHESQAMLRWKRRQYSWGVFEAMKE